MTTILRKYGYRFHFYSAEPDGERPHIHVDGHGGKSKFWLDDLTMSWQIGLNKREVSKIEKAIKEHRSELLERWNEQHG
ncbi:MAG: DUF4160 domain-containing protein [Pseudomonadota bacterium]